MASPPTATDQVVLVQGVLGEHVGYALGGAERLGRLGVRQRDPVRGLPASAS